MDRADHVRARQDSRSLLPLQIASGDSRTARRGSPPRSACSAGSSCPSRRRGRGRGGRAPFAVSNAVSISDDPCASVRGWWQRVCVVSPLEPAAGFVPLATSTVNGSPVRRAPTVTLTSVSPAPSSIAASSLVREPEPSIAEPIAHPALVVLAQVEHQHAAAGHEMRDGFGHRALRDPRRGAAPARAAPHRRWHLESAAAPARRASSDVRDAPAGRERLARAAAPRQIDRPQSLATPSGSPRPSGIPRRIRGRRPSGAAAAGRARAPRPPSFVPGTSWRSFVSGAGCASKFSLRSRRTSSSRASSARPVSVAPAWRTALAAARQRARAVESARVSAGASR